MSAQPKTWVVAHTYQGLLTLTSPYQELYFGPFANICDLERTLARLCNFDVCATATIASDARGRTKLRFSDGSRFLVNSCASPESIIPILRDARHHLLRDQRDPRRRRFALADRVRAYAS